MPQDYQWTDSDSSTEENKPSRDVTPSPDQTSMFTGEQPYETPVPTEPTRIEIPHEESLGTDVPVTTLYSDKETSSLSGTTEDTSSESAESHEEDSVSNTTKAKIIAAIAIVIVAGYVAYWVQEPVQIKADVTGATMEDDITNNADAMTDDGATTDMVAAADELPTDTSVSVDVSLFGFEPATLEIDKGTIVVWTNTSTEDQTIIGSSDDGQSFVSPVLASGEAYTYKFEQNAVFTYYSTYNPALKASIVVGLGGITGQPINEDLPAGQIPPTESPASLEADTETLNPEAEMTANELLEQAIAARDSQISTSMDDVDPPMPGTIAKSDSNALSASGAGEDQLHMVADPNSPGNLAETGPAETIYAIMFLGIAWLNRKKLYKAFSKV